MKRISRIDKLANVTNNAKLSTMLRNRISPGWHDLRAPWRVLFQGLAFTCFTEVIWEELQCID